MNELLIAIGIIVIGIGIAFAGVYLILKITSYYKSRFRVSMGSSLIAICLSMDLFLVASLLLQGNGEERYVELFNIIAFIFFAYGIYRDVCNYGKAAVGAIAFQLLIAVLQFFIVIAGIVTIVIRKVFNVCSLSH